jgi:hypothetical protein
VVNQHHTEDHRSWGNHAQKSVLLNSFVVLKNLLKLTDPLPRNMHTI